MGYHYSKKLTVTNEREEKPASMHWVKSRPRYQVRSDAGGLNTRIENCATLIEARKAAKQRARACGWAEIFQWAENGVSLKKYHVATYERELTV